MATRKKNSKVEQVAEYIAANVENVDRVEDWCKTGELLEVLTRALCEKFHADPSMPSVIVSQIKKGSPPGYYVSLVRYSAAYGEGKSVFAKATGPTIYECLVQVAHVIAEPSTTARNELRALLGEF